MLASEHTFPKTRRGSLHTKNVAGRLPPSWLKRRHGSQETPCVHTPRGWKLASRTNSEENRGGLRSSGAQTTTQRCYAQLRSGALRFLPLLFCERSSLKEGRGLQEKKTGQYPSNPASLQELVLRRAAGSCAIRGFPGSDSVSVHEKGFRLGSSYALKSKTLFIS